MHDTHTLALDEALTWIKDNYSITGLIVSGSIIRGNPNATSDFDIYVIHELPFRQRVQKFFNGVPCEIFVNNIEHIRQYFTSELLRNRPVSANIIATGKLLIGQDNIAIQTIVKEAKKYASMSPPVSEGQLLFRKYGLANLFEDASDIINSDKATTFYILDKLVAELIEFIFYSKQVALPRIKDRLTALTAIDPTSGQLLAQYYETTSFTAKYEAAKSLVLAVTGSTGFFEWSSSPE